MVDGTKTNQMKGENKMDETRYVMEKGPGDDKKQNFKTTSVTVARKGETEHEEDSKKLGNE